MRDRTWKMRMRVAVAGVGAAGLVAIVGAGCATDTTANDTDDGRQRNRRVELINLGGIE